VTDSDDSVAIDSWTHDGELRRLAADYSAFRFRTQSGWDRRQPRWVAERVKGLDAGLHTVITTDLGELLAALACDSDQAELRRQAVLRALL